MVKCNLKLKAVLYWMLIAGVITQEPATMDFNNREDNNKAENRIKTLPSSFLQIPLFPGQIVGGRQSGSLSEDITNTAMTEMLSCSWYKEAPGREKGTQMPPYFLCSLKDVVIQQMLHLHVGTVRIMHLI